MTVRNVEGRNERKRRKERLFCAMLGSSAGCSGKVPPGVEVRESVQGPSQCAWLFSLCTEAQLCLLRGSSLSCTIWAFL